MDEEEGLKDHGSSFSRHHGLDQDEITGGYRFYHFPVHISGTVVGESPDCLLLSGTVVGENPDHVCWVMASH